MKKITPIPPEIYFSPVFRDLSLEGKREMLQCWTIKTLRGKDKEKYMKKIEINKKKVMERIKATAKREKVLKKIKMLRNRGCSLQVASDKIGITRERVRQIERDILHLPARKGLGSTRRSTKKCANPLCKNVMYLPNSQIHGRIYCSRKCRFIVNPGRTPAQKRLVNKIRANKYYHQVLKKRADFKKIVRRNNLRQIARKNKLII